MCRICDSVTTITQWFVVLKSVFYDNKTNKSPYNHQNFLSLVNLFFRTMSHRNRGFLQNRPQGRKLWNKIDHDLLTNGVRTKPTRPVVLIFSTISMYFSLFFTRKFVKIIRNFCEILEQNWNFLKNNYAKL